MIGRQSVSLIFSDFYPDRNRWPDNTRLMMPGGRNDTFAEAKLRGIRRNWRDYVMRIGTKMGIGTIQCGRMASGCGSRSGTFSSEL